MTFLLLLLTPPDPANLGSRDYRVREFEQERMRLLGPLAWPMLSRAASESESPEVRMRARTLLERRDYWRSQFEVAAVLSWAHEAPDPVAFYFDTDLRDAVADLAEVNGVSDYVAMWLRPAQYDRWWFWGDVCERDRVSQALVDCRRQLWVDRYGPWFLRR